MTSAQNHQLPLSGNSWLILVLALLVSLPACKARQLGQQTPDVTVTGGEDQPDLPDTPTDTVVIVEPVDTASIDTIIKLPPIEFKDWYDVAVILPFNIDYALLQIDKAGDYYFDDEPLRLERETQLSLEFYEGLLMALDSLEDWGLNINLAVFDNKRSISETASILYNNDLDTFDIIIGPMYKESAATIAEFCKKFDVLHIEAISPSKSITTQNPNHLKLNPTIDTHLDNMVEFIADSFHYLESQVIIMYQEESGTEKAMADYIAERFDEVNALKPGEEIEYTLYAVDLFVTDKKVEPHLDGSKQNLAIIPSHNESYIHNITRILENHLNRNEITVFGLPTWTEAEAIRLDYLNKLNTHITAAVFVDPELEVVKDFNELYSDQYEQRPSDYTYIGYNTMLLAGQLLYNYGSEPQRFVDGFEYSTWSEHYVLEKAMMPDMTSPNGAKLNYYQNTYVHILKYQDYDLIRVR